MIRSREQISGVNYFKLSPTQSHPQMAAPIPAGQFQTQKCYVSAESKAATPKLRTAAKLTQYATFQVLLDA